MRFLAANNFSSLLLQCVQVRLQGLHHPHRLAVVSGVHRTSSFNDVLNSRTGHVGPVAVRQIFGLVVGRIVFTDIRFSVGGAWQPCGSMLGAINFLQTDL